MDNYHVYGIGNALVDMEFEVDDNFLKKMGIEKGVMTLVDEERQADLLKELSGPKRACGGSAANTLIALSQLGGKCYYSCKVSSDELGTFYYENLLENGVKSNLSGGREDGVTGKCMVLITPDAERTMNTFLGITSSFSINEIREEELKKAKYLYIEGYLVASASGQEACIEAVKLARKHDVKISLTLSDPNMVKFFKNNLLEIIANKVDLLFCNESEAQLFTDTLNDVDAFEALKKYSHHFAMTRGSKGAWIYNGREKHDISSHEVKAIDSNGAGDMFAGAFLYGITHGKSYLEAGNLASLAASKVVAQFGPRLTINESKSLLI